MRRLVEVPSPLASEHGSLCEAARYDCPVCGHVYYSLADEWHECPKCAGADWKHD